MGVAEILDTAIHLYRKNFVLLIMAQLPVALLFLLVSWVTKQYTTSFLDVFTSFQSIQTPTVSIWYLLLLAFIQGLIIAPIVMGAVTRIPSDSMKGEIATVKKAYSFAFRNISVLVVTNFCVSVAIGIVAGILISLPLIVFLFSLTSMAIGFGGVSLSLIISFIVMILGFIVVLFIWSRWVTVFPILVAEEGEYGTIDAMKRSWDLVKGRTLRTFFVMLVVSIIPFIIQYSPTIFEFMVFKPLPWLTILFGVLSQGLLIPLVHTTQVAVYYELRTRKEGFDLEQRVKKLEE
jgi:MFS family permease